VNAQLAAHTGQLTIALPVSLPDIQDHPHRTLAQLIGVLPLCRHDSESFGPGIRASKIAVYRSNIELRCLSRGLRGLVIFVDYSRNDRFSADGSQVGHVPDGLRLNVRGR
jgi:hypothetical protein